MPLISCSGIYDQDRQLHQRREGAPQAGEGAAGARRCVYMKHEPLRFHLFNLSKITSL